MIINQKYPGMSPRSSPPPQMPSRPRAAHSGRLPPPRSRPRCPGSPWSWSVTRLHRSGCIPTAHPTQPILCSNIKGELPLRANMYLLHHLVQPAQRCLLQARVAVGSPPHSSGFRIPAELLHSLARVLIPPPQVSEQSLQSSSVKTHPVIGEVGI